jgi:hypothetical protein
MPLLLDDILIGAAIGAALKGGTSAIGAANENAAFNREQEGNTASAAAMPYGGGSISRTHKKQNPWLAGAAGALGGAAEGAIGTAALSSLAPELFAKSASSGVFESLPDVGTMPVVEDNMWLNLMQGKSKPLELA